MAITLDWKKKLGYKKNPFSDEPTSDIVGLDDLRERISLFLLKDERLGIITGPSGTGKSSLVLWLRDELKRQRPLITISLKEHSSREKLEERLLEQTRPAYKKLFNKEEGLDDLKERLQKPLILALDDAKGLTSAQKTLLEELLKETAVQIILLGEGLKNPLDHPASLQSSIKEYTQQEFSDLLAARVRSAGQEGCYPFDEEAIEELVSESKKNPREFLRLAKEKAMELSLKAQAPPKKQKAPKKEELVRASEEKKGFGLGRFRIELVDDEDDEASREEGKKETLSDESQIDAHELNKMIEAMKKHEGK